MRKKYLFGLVIAMSCCTAQSRSFCLEPQGFGQEPLGVDSATNCSRWTTLTDTLLVPLHAAAVGAINGKIYLAGGIFSDKDGADTITEVYDPIAHKCAILASIPTPRKYMACVVMNDSLYCIGGATGSDSSFGTPSNAVEAYDPVSNTWTKKANMPTARAGCCAVAQNGYIWVMGGGDNLNALNVVERYDPSTNRWVAKASMLQARQYASAVVDCRGIIVFGGAPLSPTSCEIFPGALNGWLQFTSLPIPISNAQALSASVDIAKLFILGGLPGYSNDLWQYDYVAGAYSLKTSMPVGRANEMAVYSDGYFYVLGGEVAHDVNTSQIDRYSAAFIADYCNGSICPGDSVTLTASGPGATNFQWYFNGNPIAGATSANLITTIPGPYMATMLDEGNCPDTASFGLKNSAPAAAITPVSPVIICEGSSVTLNASPSNETYNWYLNDSTLGDINPQYAATLPGTYKVVVTDTSIGCSAADSVVVIAKPNAMALKLAASAIPSREGSNDTVALTVTPSAALSLSYPVTLSIKYDSSSLGFLSFLSGCTTTLMKVDTLHGIVTIQIDTCAVSSNPIGSLVFQSVVGGTLTPAVQIQSATSGDSCLTIQSTNTQINLTPFGCELSTLNVTPFASKIISINPNPASDHLQIDYGLVDKVLVSLTIEDIIGRTVRTLIDQVQMPGTYSATITTSGLSDGAYFVRFLTEDAKDVREIRLLR